MSPPTTGARGMSEPARLFRKKPVVIEAMLWTGWNLTHSEVFMGEGLGQGHYESFPMGPSDKLIRTLEGDMRAKPGDWLIKGVKGEFYPCKPDVFDATYEAVEP